MCFDAKSFTESVLGGSPVEIGDKVQHPSGRQVQITGGQWWGTYGLSNFWYWRECMSDGSLGPEEHGYINRAEWKGLRK